MHSGMESPKGVWWKPAHKTEKIWFAIAFAYCMVLFAMMLSREGRAESVGDPALVGLFTPENVGEMIMVQSAIGSRASWQR